jgi:6-phosphogluconolactonase
LIEINAFDGLQTQAEALARAVSGALAARLAAGAQDARACLAVSGGTSPRRFLGVLGQQAVDWSRLDLTLVDDRWVAPDHADSNTRMVIETMLGGPAAAARFVPLVDTAQAPEARVATLNACDLPAHPDVAVLGMGEDGHTASLFADAPEWIHATGTTERFVLVHPGHAPHARVSWSLQALRATPRLFLLISGNNKLKVLRDAAAGPRENAISKLANDRGVTLDVYWCAD